MLNFITFIKSLALFDKFCKKVQQKAEQQRITRALQGLAFVRIFSHNLVEYFAGIPYTTAYNFYPALVHYPHIIARVCGVYF